MELLRAMGQSMVGRGAFTYSAAISKPEEGGDWERALELHCAMGHPNVEVNTITLCAAVSACEEGGVWQRALELLCAVGQAKVERDTITFRSLQQDGAGQGVAKLDRLQCCLQHARERLRWQRTLELHHAMGHGRPGRSTVTCSAAISTCKKARQWQQALELPLPESAR